MSAAPEVARPMGGAPVQEKWRAGGMGLAQSLRPVELGCMPAIRWGTVSTNETSETILLWSCAAERVRDTNTKVADGYPRGY